MAKIPVGDTINYSYSFTFGNLLTIVGLTWLPLGLAAAITYGLIELAWSGMVQMFATQHDPQGIMDPQALMTVMSGMLGFFALAFLAYLVLLFFHAVAAAAVTGYALGLRTGPVYVHFAFGAPEWRVFGGMVRYVLAVIGVYLLFGVGVGVSVFIGTMIGGSDGSPLSWLVPTVLIIALICLFVLTIVRMGFLIVPSIVMEPGKGGLARSYHLTGGNFWRIIVVLLVTVIPVSIVQNGVMMAVLGSSMMGAYGELLQTVHPGAVSDPTAVNTALRHYFEALHGMLLPIILIGWVSSIFFNGLVSTAAAYAYRALAGAPGAEPASAPAA